MSVVKGLWIGDELGKIERLCIKSFQKQGHIFELFTYGEIKGIPEKTIIRDGNEILDTGGGIFNMFNSLNEESPKLPFDEPNSSENPNKDISEETMKDFVAMTLIFPPEIFFTLAENGIIDPNLLEDMLNSGKIKFDDTERRDKEDYGNQWRDWSPYLGDYFHDDIEDEDEEQ